MPDRPHTYTAAERLRLGHWSLAGSWTIGAESSSSHEPGGRLSCRFHARDLHLVVAPPAPGATVRFRVQLDGRDPGTDHGLDVDSAGSGTVTEPRLYQLLRRRGPVTSGTFEIEFLDPGVSVYALTFG